MMARSRRENAALGCSDPRGGYIEEALVEQPAIALLAGRGWQVVNAFGEFDHCASRSGLETRAEVAARLRLTLQRLNPEVPPETITNAVMHRDWFMEGANVFVEIYTDRIEVSSPGGLPKGMKLSDLGHKSVRRIDFIEKAGTGIKRIRDEARVQGCPEPLFEETGFVTATFFPNPEVREQAGAQSPGATEQVGTKPALSRHQVEILKKCQEERALLELIAVVGRSDRTKFRRQVLNPLIDAGLIEMTIPDKPRSSKQRYRITPAGLAVLRNSDKESQA